LDAPDTQEALQILETSLVRHGYSREEVVCQSDVHIDMGSRSEVESNYIRVYTVTHASRAYGEVYTQTMRCRVALTSTGLFVTFGNDGLLGESYRAEPEFRDVRKTFIKRFGMKNVRSRRLGYDMP